MNFNDRAVETSVALKQEEIDMAHERYGGRLTLFIARGNFDAAKALLQQAEREAAKGFDELDPFEDIPLVELLDMRIANALEEKHDAIWVKDVLKIPIDRLLATPNVGVKSVDSLLKAILKKAIERDHLRALTEMQLATARQV